jgi:hypothetical protein
MKFTSQLHIPLVRWPTRAGKFDVQIAPTVNDAAGQADVPRTQILARSSAEKRTLLILNKLIGSV